MRLFLCEKPSQAKDIARVLGATQRGNGCYSGSDLTVSWCIGHLVEAAPPEAYGPQYKSWSIEQLPIIPVRWRVDVKASTAAQFKIVEKLLATAADLVIATDADREGEMIAREILDLCEYRGPVQRLWLGALNDASIRKALGALRPGIDTLPLYHAALARSRADWLVGLNLSRLFTVLGRKAGYDGVLSVGRVQTPTLRLVVARDREITKFNAVPYWTIEVKLSASGQEFSAQWVAPDAVSDSERRCIHHSTAQNAASELSVSQQAQVRAVDTERVKEPAPLPFDLSTLQEVCSRQLNLDVQETLDIAQSLYERHKATTYPRTDSEYLPESMLPEVSTVLEALVVADPSLKPLLQTLDRTQRSRVWNDAKITAHHGIIPTLEPPTLAAMSDKELQVYRLIRAHYLAQFLPYHEYDRTIAQLACSKQTLHARGKQIVVKGWRSAFDAFRVATDPETDATQSQTLPSLPISLRCNVVDVDLRSLKTLPPKPYTQGDLIKGMKSVARLVTDPRLKQKLKDTTGIGTEATRAGIIQGLIGRGYLVQKGKAIRASATACTLIDAIPSAIADPGTTAIWEQALDLIAARQLTLEEFVNKQSAWVATIVRDHAQSTLSIELPSTPQCPICKSRTRQRTGPHGAFWSCVRYPECKGTVPIANASTSGGRKRRAAHVERPRRGRKRPANPR